MDDFATKEQIANLQRQIIEMNGQLIGLGAAIRALLLAHPDRGNALSIATAELMRWEASGLNSDVPDLLLMGFEKAKQRLLPTDGDLARIPQKPGQE